MNFMLVQMQNKTQEIGLLAFLSELFSNALKLNSHDWMNGCVQKYTL